jgi:hypothetical protein
MLSSILSRRPVKGHFRGLKENVYTARRKKGYLIQGQNAFAGFAFLHHLPEKNE